jgi:hypothetical protein
MVCVLLAGLSVAGATRLRGEEMDLVVRGMLLSPSQDEDWDSATGAEALLRHWLSPQGGVGIGVGVVAWKAVEERMGRSGFDQYYASEIEGDASVIPVGVSGILRQRLSDASVLSFEAGVRYLIVDSDVHARVWTGSASDSQYAEDHIGIENAVVGLVSVGLDLAMSENSALHGGFGFQFDLTDAGEEAFGRTIGETGFGGVLFEAGIVCRF